MINTISTDNFNRPIHDLRISVIDRCNFRCPYCMPSDKYSQKYHFLNKEDWLSFDEIERLVKLFVHCGVSKIRLTGGEPLLRPNLDQLITRLKHIEGIEDLALTTNGSMLFEYAEQLKTAGLDRLTVSLDSLDNKAFTEMTGGKGILKDVKQGIHEATRVGFTSIKFNTVIQRGLNDHTIMELVDFFRDTPHILRFIEYMDVGTCNNWDRANVMPSRDIVSLINEHYPLTAQDPNYFGEVARRYAYEDGRGEVGFISSVTQPFCGSCTRARLSTDGQIYTCLFAQKGTDLRSLLRSNAHDAEILNLIEHTWQTREDRYSEIRHTHTNTPEKIEMYQIGG